MNKQIIDHIVSRPPDFSRIPKGLDTVMQNPERKAMQQAINRILEYVERTHSGKPLSDIPLGSFHEDQIILGIIQQACEQNQVAVTDEIVDECLTTAQLYVLCEAGIESSIDSIRLLEGNQVRQLLGDLTKYAEEKGVTPGFHPLEPGAYEVPFDRLQRLVRGKESFTSYVTDQEYREELQLAHTRQIGDALFEEVRERLGLVEQPDKGYLGKKQ